MVPSFSTPKVLSQVWGGRWEGQLAEQQGREGSLQRPLPAVPTGTHLTSAHTGFPTSPTSQDACLIMHYCHFHSGLEIPSLIRLDVLPYNCTVVCTVE